MSAKFKKRYVLGVGYPWGIDLVNDGLCPTGIRLHSESGYAGSDKRITLKHLGKWGAWEKYKLVLERVK